MTRETLHRLVDQLPPDQWERAHTLLQAAVDRKPLEPGDSTTALAALEASHKQLTTILDSISESFSIVDREFRIIYMNPVAEASLLEVGSEDVLGKVVWDLFPDLVGTAAYDAAVRALKEGTPQSYELYYEPLDRWSEGRIYPSADGLSSFSRDVTSEKKAAQAVKRWQQVFHSARWGLALATPGAKTIVDCNPAYAAMHGYTPDELRGRSLLELFPASAHTQQLRGLEQVRQAGHQVYESQHQRKDGTVFPVLLDVSIILDDDGKEAYWAASVQDLSSQKMVELTVQRQKEMLDTVSVLGRMLTAEMSLDKLVQAMTDACTRLSGAEFGAFFYNQTGADGESYLLYTLSGVDRNKFAHFPMPRNTAVFGPTFRGEGIVRSDDITLDPRYGHNEPYHGLPPGHLPVRSYLAIPVASRGGEVLGGLFFGHSAVGVFTEHVEGLLATIASQAAVAIENVRLYETALRERREAEIGRHAFGLIADSMPQLVWTVDDQGRMDYWNRGFTDYLGLAAADIPKEWNNIVYPDDLERTLTTWARALESGQNFNCEYRMRRHDGRYRWFLGRALPLRDEHNTVIKWFGTATDIEDQKHVQLELSNRTLALEAAIVKRRKAEEALQTAAEQLEARVAARTQQLEEANVRLQEMDRLKSQFISTMSHELRTPLNAIIGFSELLQSDSDSELTPGERREFVEHIAHGGQILLELVNDILDLARIEAGRLQLDWTRTVLLPVIEQALNIVRPLMEEKGQTVEVDCDATVEALVDVPRLHQILLNLLSNAIKFTPAGGRLKVRLRDEERGVTLQVEDNGPGIEADEVEQVFVAFERGRGRQEPGTGLGLAISKRLAEAHRGHLELQSEVGKGSIFTVVLPSLRNLD